MDAGVAARRLPPLEDDDGADVHYPKIDFQNLYYCSAPKSTEGPKNLDEVDPELLRTYARLGPTRAIMRGPRRRDSEARSQAEV
jgi:hypothetical protein